MRMYSNFPFFYIEQTGMAYNKIDHWYMYVGRFDLNRVFTNYYRFLCIKETILSQYLSFRIVLKIICKNFKVLAFNNFNVQDKFMKIHA